MASRGLLPFAGNFDRRIAAPIDDMRVATKADLILPATWTAGDGVVYISKGMVAVVYNDPTPENNGSYVLLADDYTVQASWEKDGKVVDLSHLMVESEYTGETGTKQVNYAKSAEEAEQAIHSYSANQDALGREIHTTYALKQSGVTPPETARVILDDVTPTYTIEALTAENLIVENNATTGGEIIAPVLAADKTLKISIIGNDTLLNGTSYADGVTIFAIYEASTETWTFNSILDPEVPDYSDMTVDIMLDNPTVLTSIRNGFLVAGFIDINKTVFIRTHSTAIGIYQCFALYSGNAYLEPIAAGTALHTVRVKDGDVWYSQYDGKNAGTLVFESFDNKVDKNGTDRLLTQDEAELIEGMSPIEFEVTDVINGIIIPESPTKLYRISTATDLTVTINTALLDLTKYIKLFVKINLNDYVVLTFPNNWYFANLAIPTEVGEYLYEVSSSDGGATWRASLRYKNIATVGIDQEGNEIVGAKTLFVDGEKADNSGNGLTWLTAKKDVQAAIDIANTGDAVFVKGKLDGLKYLPTTERTPGTARSKSFIMKAGVNVYGGFMGIESNLYERQMVRYPQTMNLPTGTFTMYVDIPKYRSILSGEIGGDSIINPSATVGNQFTFASIANNSYLVVLGAASTVLNGFEVIGGYTSGGSAAGVSGGIVVNCKVYNNTTYSQGAGVYACTAINSIISYNNCTHNISSAGGGAANSTIQNCILHSNSSIGTTGGGGACHNCTIKNSALHSNVHGGNGERGGGGCINSDISNSVIFNNLVSSSIGSGGGVRGGNATNCSIYNNSSPNGGGLYGVIATSCFVYNNTGGNGGGVYGGTATNCSIYNNSGTNGGGSNGGTLINCSVVRNKATLGAGTYNSILQNTVVYGNKTGALVKSNVYNDNASAETYSAFEDEVRTGTGNISLSVNNSGDATSPCFQSLSNDVGVVDEIYVSNLKICNDSYLIDKGLDSYLTTGYGSLYDIESKPRKVDTIDIGAYENQKTV